MKPITKETFLVNAVHCRHCKDPHVRTLRRANHKNLERLESDVLHVLRIGAVNDWLLNGNVTRESIAAHFEVPEHQIDQVFQSLKVKGYMGTGVNHAPHDSNRDPGGGWDSSWMGTRYPVRVQAVMRTLD